MTAPGQAPTETTRLRLEHEGAGIVAHLSAMTVAHGGLELYHAKVGGGDRGGGGALWHTRVPWRSGSAPLLSQVTAAGRERREQRGD